MGMLHSIWYGKEEPPRNTVLWAKPVNGGFAFYIFDGKWKPQKVMDDKGTPSTGDDEPYTPGGGEIDPDTVGTEEIKDGSIGVVDLNQKVKDKLDNTYVQDSESLYINGTKPE